MDALPKAKMLYELAAALEKDFEIDLQLLDIGETEHNKKGNRFQKCTVSDGTHSKEIKVYEGRNGVPLNQNATNEWATFSLSARSFKGNTYIGGFWQSDAPKVMGKPQTTPAVPYQQTASTIVPDGRDGMQMPTTYAYPVTPETQKRMSRSVAVEAASKIVMAMVAHGHYDKGGSLAEAENDTVEAASIFALYIAEGVTNASEPISQETCPSCRLLRVDCTCPTQDFIR